MKIFFTVALLTLFIVLLGQDSVHAIPTAELDKRDPALSYFTVHAPSENISPAAAALAASLEGQVLPFKLNLTKVPH